MNIGKNIEKIRKEKGISQERLSAKCEITKQSIYLIENNRTKNPSIKTLEKIANVLEVPLTELIKK